MIEGSSELGGVGAATWECTLPAKITRRRWVSITAPNDPNYGDPALATGPTDYWYEAGR